jgi:hypothetical protein
MQDTSQVNLDMLAIGDWYFGVSIGILMIYFVIYWDHIVVFARCFQGPVPSPRAALRLHSHSVRLGGA